MKRIKVKERTHIDFDARKHSVYGIVSCVLVCIAVILMVSGIVISYQHQGQSSPLIGIVGVIDLILGVAGAILGYHGNRKKGKINHKWDMIGLILNLLVVAAVAAIYIFGTTLLGG